MRSYKVTKKAVTNRYHRIISIDCCGAEYLLSKRSREAYTAGFYGWNFAVYNVSDILPGTAICTGYRNMPKGLKYDYKALDEANKRAKEGDPEEALKDFIDHVVKENINK